MSATLTTFLFELANFLTLAAVLGWLLFKPVRKALEDQQARARSREEEAARKLAEAEKQRQEMEAQRQSLASELDTMRSQAREIARKEAEAILAEARQRLERERATQRQQALHLENAQMTKIAQAIVRTTHSVLGRFLEQLQGQELEQTLRQAACQEVERIADHPLAPVTIESAAPLDAEAKQRIEQALGPARETAQYRVDPDLIAGLRICTAQGLVDASAAGLTHFAGQSLQAELAAAAREESQGE